MLFEEKALALKDGRTAILRAPRASDAEDMIQYMKDTAAETPFVLRYPDEVTMTVEQEEHFIAAVNSSPADMMIACEVDGRIAGNCHLSFKTRRKNAHIGTIAIALRRDYWNQGIGTAMFREMIAAARAREGVTMLELEVIEGNSRARALYEKMGFRVVGIHPNAIRMEDGSLVSEFFMALEL